MKVNRAIYIQRKPVYIGIEWNICSFLDHFEPRVCINHHSFLLVPQISNHWNKGRLDPTVFVLWIILLGTTKIIVNKLLVTTKIIVSLRLLYRYNYVHNLLAIVLFRRNLKRFYLLYENNKSRVGIILTLQHYLDALNSCKDYMIA